MKKRKKKNAITLLALVITIVIMLLLAGVAIQMTMGENGLIAKSVQAQKEQAKAELYDTAKLSYTSLNARAIENGQPSPQAELALSTTEFRVRYDIVGDDITDKKGTVIDTKENVLNVISGLKGASEDTEISMKGEYVEKPWPKTVAGVTIPEEDKDKMILKLKIKNNTKIYFGTNNSSFHDMAPIEIDYGNGEKEEITDLFHRPYKQYSAGEYILKFKNIRDFTIGSNKDKEVEIIQWGKITEKNEENYIEISNVSKVYEPEPDRIPITYSIAKFTEIPEWLFSKKVTSKEMSKFYYCLGLTSIPEGLFKNNVNVETFDNTFYGCTGLTSIPEGLFKNNVNATNFRRIFEGCTGLTSIPEGLFKNNVNVKGFYSTFNGCTGLISIPEGLFKNNVNVKGFYSTFNGCTGLTSIPEGLFKNNVNATNFEMTFVGCTGLTSIPEELFKNNVNAVKFHNTFDGCTGLTSIPEGLFKNCVNATYFYSTFERCTGITSIPEGLFKNNVNVIDFRYIFESCTGLISIPEKIIEFGKKVKERGGYVGSMFLGCTSATNYNSLPDYMK